MTVTKPEIEVQHKKSIARMKRLSVIVAGFALVGEKGMSQRKGKIFPTAWGAYRIQTSWRT
jgi:hypothetical protein